MTDTGTPATVRATTPLGRMVVINHVEAVVRQPINSIQGPGLLVGHTVDKSEERAL